MADPEDKNRDAQPIDQGPEFDLLRQEHERARRLEREPEGAEDLLDVSRGKLGPSLRAPGLGAPDEIAETDIDPATPHIHMGGTGAGTGTATTAPAAKDIDLPTSDATAPLTNIVIDNMSVDEGSAGAVIGSLTVLPENLGDARTYSVSDDRFEVIADVLKLKSGIGLDYDTEQNIRINIEVRDANDVTYSQPFTVQINDIDVAPTDIDLDNLSVDEETPGALVGRLSTFDPDMDDTHTYAVSDDRFVVVGDQLRLKDGVELDHESEPRIEIDVTSTDQSGLSYTESFMLEVSDIVWPEEVSPDNIAIDQPLAAVADTFVGNDNVSLVPDTDIAYGGNIPPDGGADVIAGDATADAIDLAAMADAGVGWTIVFDDGSSFEGSGTEYLDLSEEAAGTIYFNDGSEMQFIGLEDLEQ